MPFCKPFFLAAVLSLGAVSGAHATTIKYQPGLELGNQLMGGNAHANAMRGKADQVLGARDRASMRTGRAPQNPPGLDVAQMHNIFSTQGKSPNAGGVFPSQGKGPMRDRGPGNDVQLTGQAQGSDSTLAADPAATTLSPVPLPASGLLLIGALGGLAVLRRRRKAA